MTTVAIISEYNPFHSGHAYQINAIREEFGEDTAIISIMSGNFTQRGEFAFMPKTDRAKCAILGGANLVLELPFPFCSSSADLFSKSGIKIAESLGVVDYLSFGSESGDIGALYRSAKVYLSDEFKNEFKKLSLDKSLGYPQRCELAFKKASDGADISFTPNNILAIEYIKTLLETKSKIKPHTVKRLGASYDSTEFDNNINQSASAIRKNLFNAENSALNFVPDACRSVINDSILRGDTPCEISRVSAAFVSYLRLNSSTPLIDYHDANDGLYNRLYNFSFEANDITSLLKLSETKNYTRSRIRRALLNIYFGVTSSDVKNLPHYTQVLGMDSLGMKILKQVKKSEFNIITKPSAFGELDEIALKQKQLSDKADSIFELSKPNPKHGRSTLMFTPFIKK